MTHFKVKFTLILQICQYPLSLRYVPYKTSVHYTTLINFYPQFICVTFPVVSWRFATCSINNFYYYCQYQSQNQTTCPGN